MEKEFKVGDKVVRNYNVPGTRLVGTIIRITPKRKDVVVDYGSYEEIYDASGWQKNGTIWNQSYITLITPEIEKELNNRNIINKCKIVFDRTKLTVDQAIKILEILGEENGTEK